MALVAPPEPVASTSKILLPDFTSSRPPHLESGDPGLDLDSDAFRHVELAIEDFIKRDKNLRLRLDTDDQLCKDYLSPDGCLKGAACPYRHARPSDRNFRPPSPPPNLGKPNTVCKHWLRGLCKKGAGCDYLHEYDLLKVAECFFFQKNGFCAAGDECMYLHVSPHDRRGECKGYTRGFCPLGPTCPKKHIRKVACPLFLTGFCPRGKECPQAHPPFLLADLFKATDPALKQRFDAYGNRVDGMAGAPVSAYTAGANPGVVVAGMGRGRGFMRDVTCHKCGQKGHLAPQCPNPSVPGLRGGVERGPGGRVLTRESGGYS